jgi:DNA invertase Pin-like site-specific DNA recombinase
MPQGRCPEREHLLFLLGKAVKRYQKGEIDVVLVWRLDRWGRSVTDLLATLQELEHLGVGFVSLTEALDLTTPAGRAMARPTRHPGSSARSA